MRFAVVLTAVIFGYVSSLEFEQLPTANVLKLSRPSRHIVVAQPDEEIQEEEDHGTLPDFPTLRTTPTPATTTEPEEQEPEGTLVTFPPLRTTPAPATTTEPEEEEPEGTLVTFPPLRTTPTTTTFTATTTETTTPPTTKVTTSPTTSAPTAKPQQADTTTRTTESPNENTITTSGPPTFTTLGPLPTTSIKEPTATTSTPGNIKKIERWKYDIRPMRYCSAPGYHRDSVEEKNEKAVKSKRESDQSSTSAGVIKWMKELIFG